MSSEALQVYLRGALIGALESTRRGARFSFSEDIAKNHEGSPLLSTALPAQGKAFDSTKTAHWFTGLLLEDNRLTELQRYFGVPESGYLPILKEVGWECAGAVSVSPYSQERNKAEQANMLYPQAAQRHSQATLKRLSGLSE